MCWVIVQGEAKFVRYAVLLESFAARQGASWYLYQTERPREVERHLHWFTARYESFLLLHSQRIAAKTTRHQCRRSTRKVAGALLRRRTCAHVPSSQIKRKRNPKKEEEVPETMIYKPNRNSAGGGGEILYKGFVFCFLFAHARKTGRRNVNSTKHYS